MLEQREKINKFVHEKARTHLNKIQICDICQIKSFICEYQKYYYQLDEETKETYKDIFIDKLPYLLNPKIKRLWESRQDETANTLGGIIQILYQELR